MSNRKKYFPRNSTPGRLKVRRTISKAKSIAFSEGGSRCRNLRDEFDKMVREKHTLLSDDQVDHLWNAAVESILRYPQVSLETHIEKLHIGTP